MTLAARFRQDARFRQRAMLGVILALGALLRLYHITAPPYDFLSWRDTQTLMVARNFYRDGMNLFLPAVDWRTTYAVDPRGTVGGTELMVVPYLTAILYHLFGLLYWVGRVVPIGFAVLGIYWFFRLVERHAGEMCAAAASLLLTASPYYLYCGRCQMPESFALSMSFATLYFYDAWLRQRKRGDYARAAASALLMLLGKPQMGVMAITMALLTVQALGWRAVLEWRLYAFAALVGIPFAAYMWWTSWVLVGRTGISFSGPSLLAHGRWLANPRYYYDLARSIWLWSVTPPVCVLAVLGLVGGRRGLFLPAAWLAGAVSLFVLMPGGASANGYYQIILAPPCAFLAARALTAAGIRRRVRWLSAATLVVALAWQLTIATRLYRPSADVHADACGAWLNRNTEPSALVLCASPSTAALYFADRTGWTSWQEYYGQGARFNADLVNKVLPLGASVLAVPYPHDWFDNPYHGQFNDIRDALYETYPCYKEDAFTVFFLNQRARLSLPESGRLVFGTLDSRRYLRGAWGPNQTDAGGQTFATLGPANAAAIQFDTAGPVPTLVLEVASPLAGQTLRIGIDGTELAAVALEAAGRRAELQLDTHEVLNSAGRHTITIEAAMQNRDRVGMLLYRMDAPAR